MPLCVKIKAKPVKTIKRRFGGGPGTNSEQMSPPDRIRIRLLFLSVPAAAAPEAAPLRDRAWRTISCASIRNDLETTTPRIKYNITNNANIKNQRNTNINVKNNKNIDRKSRHSNLSFYTSPNTHRPMQMQKSKRNTSGSTETLRSSSVIHITLLLRRRAVAARRNNQCCPSKNTTASPEAVP